MSCARAPRPSLQPPLEGYVTLRRRAVRAGDHDGVAVRIAQPAFPMVRATITGWWVAMTGQGDLGIHLRRAGNGFIKVVDLKPQQNTIALRLVVRIADRSVVVIDLDAVQPQDQPVIRDQSLIFRAAVRALAPEQTLVPAATRFDIRHCDEGLGTHFGIVA